MSCNIVRGGNGSQGGTNWAMIMALCFWPSFLGGLACDSKPETTIPALIEQLKHQDVDVASRAANQLARIGPPAIPALIQVMLNEKHERARLGAIYALGEMGPQASAAVPHLVDAVKHEHCPGSAAALGKIGCDPETVVPVLIQALNEDRRRLVSIPAAEALGKFGPAAKDAVPVLIRALAYGDQHDSWDQMVRSRAAWSLGEIGEEEAIPALRNAAQTAYDSNARDAARKALDKLQRK